MNDLNELINRTADIAIAALSNIDIEPHQVPGLITGIYGALSDLAPHAAPVEPTYEPAVNPKRSIQPDHLISLIDGKPYKMLKRHLAQNGLTPDQYRARYGLKPDYPMVAAAYAEKRRDLAKKIGLGRKPGARKAA
jgi:predicted transcriptional regulator